jgi:hypothetical protein
MAHLGKYPVVSLSLKDVKAQTWTEAFHQISRVLAETWRNFEYLTESAAFKQHYTQMQQGVEEQRTDVLLFDNALKALTQYLHAYHQSPVVVLIDEYDTPVQEAWLNGYYDEMVAFMRSLLGQALKDNDYLKKGVLTGILRITKESMFSDLNNFIASTVMDHDYYSTAFGFTEEEVAAMLQHYQLNSKEMEEVQQWYDGYRFGRNTIYNPWSVLNYVYSIDHDLKPYWVNTSENRLLRSLFFNKQAGIRDRVEALMRGEKIEVSINPNIVFRDLQNRQTAVWSLLLQAGYLRCENPGTGDRYDISIPNKEIREAYRNTIGGWIEDDMEATMHEPMLQALVGGDMVIFEEHLQAFVEKVFSFYDTVRGQAENFYHAFFLGLLARYEHAYQLRSNREAGLGRYDIALIPKDTRQAGVLIEIKAPNAARKETLAQALSEAARQFQDNRYEADMAAHSVTKIVRVAIAVQGKRVKVQQI